MTAPAATFTHTGYLEQGDHLRTQCILSHASYPSSRGGRRWSHYTSQPQCPWPSSSKPYLHNGNEWVRVSRLEVVALSSLLRLIVSMYRTPEVHKGKIDTERTHMLCDSMTAKRGPLTSHIFQKPFYWAWQTCSHSRPFSPCCALAPFVTAYARV